MSTVPSHAPSRPFDIVSFANATLHSQCRAAACFARQHGDPSVADPSAANADYTARDGGHLDEATAIQTTEEIPADFVESYEAYTLDQEIQRADAAALAEMGAAFEAAKDAVGNAHLRFSRIVVVEDESGPRHNRIDYACAITGEAGRFSGIGASPREALANALEDLDGPRGPITPGPGFTYRVAGLALIEAHPHRTAADAKAFARRIAIEPSYLDGAIEFALPGIIDERPKRNSAA